jgi:hypothetical protein
VLMRWAGVAGYRQAVARGHRFADGASPRQCMGRAFLVNVTTRICAMMAVPTIRTAPSRSSGVRADGQNNWDLAFLKNSQIREGVQLQFRAEATNALNHPQFLTPNTSVTSTAFGTITGEWSWPRTIQFGLKLIF